MTDVDKRDFYSVSIRGMVAYCIMRLENFIPEAYPEQDFSPVLRLVWRTSSFVTVLLLLNQICVAMVFRGDSKCLVVSSASTVVCLSSLRTSKRRHDVI